MEAASPLGSVSAPSGKGTQGAPRVCPLPGSSSMLLLFLVLSFLGAAQSAQLHGSSGHTLADQGTRSFITPGVRHQRTAGEHAVLPEKDPSAAQDLQLARLRVHQQATKGELLVGNVFCNNSYVWLSSGAVRRSSNWASFANTTSFRMGPCLQVSGIGVAVTQDKKLLIIDRSGATNSYVRVPGTNNLAFAQVLALKDSRQRALNILTNAFCSSGQFAPNGVFYSIGGDGPDGYVANGKGSIRGFRPCNSTACKFFVAGEMRVGRWYATTQLLGDGRILIVGGSSKGASINNRVVNRPSVEYFPRKPGEGVHGLKFLSQTLPYNLFPFVHLLPSGRVFIFGGNRYILFDTKLNKEVPGTRPQLNQFNDQGQQMFWSYPLSGTSVLMPLRPWTRYLAEVMLCGGASTGSRNSSSVGDPWAAASDKCYRVQPEARNPKWLEETMYQPRIMSYGVLLPDGMVAFLGGAQSGWAALSPPGRTACHGPALQAIMWDAYHQQWYEGPLLAQSKVPRVYHSSAILVHDGSVFISGSNPNSNIILNQKEYPIEFRTELFYPPYMQDASSRPILLNAPGVVKIGKPFSLRFKPSLRPRKVDVVLAYPGYSTHGANHGMRNVLLSVTELTGNRDGTYSISAEGPPNKNVCPPTWYMLFVVVNGLPQMEAKPVYVQ